MANLPQAQTLPNLAQATIIGVVQFELYSVFSVFRVCKCTNLTTIHLDCKGKIHHISSQINS